MTTTRMHSRSLGRRSAALRSELDPSEGGASETCQRRAQTRSSAAAAGSGSLVRTATQAEAAAREPSASACEARARSRLLVSSIRGATDTPTGRGGTRRHRPARATRSGGVRHRLASSCDVRTPAASRTSFASPTARPAANASAARRRGRERARQRARQERAETTPQARKCCSLSGASQLSDMRRTERRQSARSLAGKGTKSAQRRLAGLQRCADLTAEV